MNKKECAECLAILRLNYKASFKDMTENDAKAFINLWSMQFADETYSEVMTAINYIIATDVREFAPPIGLIRAKITEMKTPNRLSTTEAWDLVRTACGRPDGFKTLPPIVQKAVGSSGVLRSWGEADINVFNSSIMANFRRSYETVINEEKETLRLPSILKEQVKQIRDNTLMLSETLEG